MLSQKELGIGLELAIVVCTESGEATELASCFGANALASCVGALALEPGAVFASCVGANEATVGVEGFFCCVPATSTCSSCFTACILLGLLSSSNSSICIISAESSVGAVGTSDCKGGKRKGVVDG